MNCEDKGYASRGVANAGLVTGIAGSVGLLNSLANGLSILGGGTAAANAAVCSENSPVTRYELQQEQKISELQSQVTLRDANTYHDQKMLEMYKYIDGKISGLESQLCQQAVINGQITSNIACMQQEINKLSDMTKTVIPIDNICPQPATATTTGAA